MTIPHGTINVGSTELPLDGVDLFCALFDRYWTKAVEFAALAKNEGILALESRIDDNALLLRDPFEVGIRLLIDGTEPEMVDQILDNISLASEKINKEGSGLSDRNTKILNALVKQVMRMISEGNNPRFVDIVCQSLYPREYGPIYKKASVNKEKVTWTIITPEELKKVRQVV